MNESLLICIINTLLIILTTNVCDANSSPSSTSSPTIQAILLQPTNLHKYSTLRRKAGKGTLEQSQQKYQQIKDDIKEIKDIINDLPIADPIVETELNNKLGRKELLKKTNLKKLETLNERAPLNKTSDLSPYGKKWREIVHIEEEYNAHNSSMVMHLFKFWPFVRK